MLQTQLFLTLVFLSFVCLNLRAGNLIIEHNMTSDFQLDPLQCNTYVCISVIGVLVSMKPILPSASPKTILVKPWQAPIKRDLSCCPRFLVK